MALDHVGRRNKNKTDELDSMMRYSLTNGISLKMKRAAEQGLVEHSMKNYRCV
jgi:hypothetical protein